MKLFNFKAFLETFSQFIQNTISHVMAERKVNGIKRNDLIDIFIELMDPENSTAGEVLTLDMLMAQAATFYLAGFETSSSTQSFAMYEIAKNESIQERLRKEIREMLLRTEGKVTYDAVMSTTEMPYLNQVIRETLRLYSFNSFLDRKCEVPDGYSLEPFSDYKIPYGMPIYIPIYAIQRDEKYFRDPLKFDPDRFSPENIGNIIPFTNRPFGSGLRNCIGERFALRTASENRK